jgi:hypothetical protein
MLLTIGSTRLPQNALDITLDNDIQLRLRNAKKFPSQAVVFCFGSDFISLSSGVVPLRVCIYIICPLFSKGYAHFAYLGQGSIYSADALAIYGMPCRSVGDQIRGFCHWRLNGFHFFTVSFSATVLLVRQR